MAADNFAGMFNLTNPARRSFPIVPSDGSPDLPEVPRAILVGDAGTIVGQLIDDVADRTFKLTAGEHGLRFKSIKATGTTAANLLGLC